ncbi:anti-sigma factor [Cellulophaga baltica]|uniref:anti-sigma factor n=1 Tax=Cellulophaga TaxID=104264 RepID=UPI001C076BA8|nr:MULTISPECIES: anti-sigma factor [Cellulophaga]MBU2994991.1 anti-sigma factor [Cellulophaga baltica]MDO6766386.1 anti-sigma factor [Cellulophaga sp. 1_MG-2023]
MKDKIKDFLDTDLLEKYLLGTTTELEKHKVERYIAMYPEVRKTYNELQDNLEEFAKIYALKTPEGLKEKITNTVKAQSKTKRKFINYAIAASVVTFISITASYFFYNENQNLQEENTVVTNQIKLLEADMKQRLEDVRNQFIVLNNPQTKKYNVRGNKRGKDLKAVAYVNPVKKLSYINLQNMPHLEEGECLQMWAEVNGEMINLGILRDSGDKDNLLALPYAKNAVGYITIEPKGGNETPTVDNIVANISIN